MKTYQHLVIPSINILRLVLNWKSGECCTLNRIVNLDYCDTDSVKKITRQRMQYFAPDVCSDCHNTDKTLTRKNDLRMDIYCEKIINYFSHGRKFVEPYVGEWTSK